MRSRHAHLLQLPKVLKFSYERNTSSRKFLGLFSTSLKDPKEYSTYHSHTIISRNVPPDNPMQPSYVHFCSFRQAISNTVAGAGSTNKPWKYFQLRETFYDVNYHIPNKNRGVSRNSPYQYVAFMRISAFWTFISRYSADKCWQTLIAGTYKRERSTTFVFTKCHALPLENHLVLIPPQPNISPRPKVNA